MADKYREHGLGEHKIEELQPVLSFQLILLAVYQVSTCRLYRTACYEPLSFSIMITL